MIVLKLQRKIGAPRYTILIRHNCDTKVAHFLSPNQIPEYANTKYTQSLVQFD